MPFRKFADEFQDVDPVHSFQRFVATMALKPVEKLASTAQVLETARRNEAAYVAQVLIVVAKDSVERTVGRSCCLLRRYTLFTKVLPEVMHSRASILEEPVGGQFLFKETFDQSLIDLI